MVTQLQPDVRAYLHGAEVIKRYIRVEEVAREYGLINTDIFEMYLEKFKEPTRPLPKHIWNKLSGEDKKDHNSTCFDKKDP